MVTTVGKNQYPEKIVWVDSCGSSGAVWSYEDNLVDSLKPVEVTSVGYIVKETKKRILIVGHRALKTEQVSGAMVIPTCAIISRVKLREDVSTDRGDDQ